MRLLTASAIHARGWLARTFAMFCKGRLI